MKVIEPGPFMRGERPGAPEFIALALVLASLFTVLFQPQAKKSLPEASVPVP